MYVIRTAGEEDAEAIARTVNAAFEVERPVRGPIGNRTSAENVRELMRGGNIFFVAEEGGKIAGAVFVRIAKRADSEDAKRAESEEKTGYFGMLAVDPTLQHSGVGRILREQVERYAKDHGCALMTLTTGEFRTELIPYYERAGYKTVAVEPGPAAWGFAKPFRVVHMAKVL